MNFYDWLQLKYGNEDSYKGDFAEDARIYNEEFPKKYNDIMHHLFINGACSECIETFKDCWKEYKKELKIKK